MADLKIKTYTTYKYETSDGREFDIAEEAKQWQEYLEIMKNVIMLDCRFNNTNDVCSAIYVHIKNNEQLDAFEAMQAYEGMCAHINKPGYWYYDDHTDSYIDAVEERTRLQSIIAALDISEK